MGSWESEVIACFWKGNFVSRFLLTAERRECKESYTLRKRTLHPLRSSGWLDSNIQFGRYPIPSGNRLFKYLVSLWWSELWRGSDLGQTQSFIAKGEQHTTQRVEVSSWEKSVSTETLRHWQILCSSTRPRIQENHFPFAMFQHFTFSCWLEIFSSRLHLNNCRYIQPLPTDYCHNNGCQPGLQVLMLHPAGRSSTNISKPFSRMPTTIELNDLLWIIKAKTKMRKYWILEASSVDTTHMHMDDIYTQAHICTPYNTWIHQLNTFTNP